MQQARKESKSNVPKLKRTSGLTVLIYFGVKEIGDQKDRNINAEIKPATMKIPNFKQNFPVGNEFRSRQALPDVEDEKCNAIECSKLCVSKVG